MSADVSKESLNAVLIDIAHEPQTWLVCRSFIPRTRSGLILCCRSVLHDCLRATAAQGCEGRPGIRSSDL
jgi:hypothetical protein